MPSVNITNEDEFVDDAAETFMRSLSSLEQTYRNIRSADCQQNSQFEEAVVDSLQNMLRTMKAKMRTIDAGCTTAERRWNWTLYSANNTTVLASKADGSKLTKLYFNDGRPKGQRWSDV